MERGIYNGFFLKKYYVPKQVLKVFVFKVLSKPQKLFFLQAYNLVMSFLVLCRLTYYTPITFSVGILPVCINLD